MKDDYIDAMRYATIRLPEKWYEKTRLIKFFKEVAVVFFFQLVFLRIFEFFISNDAYLYLLSITAGGVLYYFFNKFERSEKMMIMEEVPNEDGSYSYKVREGRLTRD